VVVHGLRHHHETVLEKPDVFEVNGNERPPDARPSSVYTHATDAMRRSLVVQLQRRWAIWNPEPSTTSDSCGAGMRSSCCHPGTARDQLVRDGRWSSVLRITSPVCAKAPPPDGNGQPRRTVELELVVREGTAAPSGR